MAGADGATEGPPDATYAALEGPRFVTAPEPARQSVLSHSKSHPRMLESASTTGHPPRQALSCGVGHFSFRATERPAASLALERTADRA